MGLYQCSKIRQKSAKKSWNQFSPKKNCEKVEFDLTTHALFASKAKSNVFWKIFEWIGSKGARGVMKRFQKMLILVFEVILQNHPNTFEIAFFFPTFRALYCCGVSKNSAVFISLLKYFLLYSTLSLLLMLPALRRRALVDPLVYIVGVKVRNMKMDFNTGGTWSRVGQWTLMIKINDFFFIRLSRYQAMNNNM